MQYTTSQLFNRIAVQLVNNNLKGQFAVCFQRNHHAQRKTTYQVHKALQIKCQSFSMHSQVHSLPVTSMLTWKFLLRELCGPFCKIRSCSRLVCTHRTANPLQDPAQSSTNKSLKTCSHHVQHNRPSHSEIPVLRTLGDRDSPPSTSFQKLFKTDLFQQTINHFTCLFVWSVFCFWRL